MSCMAEYIGYCGSAVAAGAAFGAVVVELGSGVGAPLSVPTAAAAIAAALALIASGMAYSNCLENEGKAEEARKMREDMDELRFNTAIAKLIELNNAVTKLDAAPRTVAEALVLMVAPLAPHVAEELWRKLGHDETVTYVDFPVADAQYLVDDTIEYPVQVNGKLRSHIVVAASAGQADVEAAVMADDKVLANLEGATPKKVIFVPGRMVNIVI